MRNLFLAAVVLLTISSFTFAGASFDLGYGYSKLEMDGRDENLDGAGGMGGDLHFGIGILPHVVDPLRLNLRGGFRYYDESGSGNDDNHPEDSTLLLMTGEIGVSWKQYFGPVFIEPGISGVGIVGNYNADADNQIIDFDQTETGWGFRPSVRAGVQLTIFEAGIEASYMWGNISFDDGVGGDFKEFYLGAFVGLSW